MITRIIFGGEYRSWSWLCVHIKCRLTCTHSQIIHT
jgi:hypothetical protein